MDDTRDRSYARAPEIQDVLKLCRSLNEQGVKYLLIGGFAVIFHGATRTTKDIDLLIDPSEDNVQKIKKAMAYLPDNAISLIDDHDVENYKVVRVGDEIVVDLMESACGIRYEEVEKTIEWKVIEGVQIPVASKSTLFKMKETLRPSDKADRLFLAELLRQENQLTRK